MDCTYLKADTIDLPGIKPCWCVEIRRYSPGVHSQMSFSRILPNVTGLYVFGSVNGFPFPFGITTSLPLFQTSGKTPSLMHLAYTRDISASATPHTTLTMRAVIPSNPAPCLAVP
ncbi:unnamed protein product [Leptosia nina]|uniref:Uncharacterized protein n=1 Tax=Leptosia nina TaxID=320188 RepID=A0AAV1K2Q3_9NEOP